MKLFTVQEAAELLGIGSKQLFKFLREQDYLTKANLPRDQYLATGLFEIRHSCWIHPRHGQSYTGRTMITQRGVSQIDLRLREQKTARLRRRDSQAANEAGTTRSIKQGS